jgi:hypothetical protein
MKKKGDLRKMYPIGLLFVFLLLVGAPNIVLAQARLDIPTANLQIENAVPMSVIKKIAQEKASETWGPGAIGTPIPLADLNGDVVVYMVPYKIGGNKFPTYDEVLAGIKEGREMRNLIKNSGMEKAKAKYMSMEHKKVENPRGVVIAKSQEPQRSLIDPVRPDGSFSRRMELDESKEVEKFAVKKSIGADEFGTIFVSAAYDKFPVLAYFHYLAPYIVNFDLALERAEQAIGPGAVLKSIYFLGLEGQFLAFENASSSTLLNSKTFEANSLEKLKKSKISPAQASADPEMLPENKEQIKVEISKEWEKLLAEIGGE